MKVQRFIAPQLFSIWVAGSIAVAQNSAPAVINSCTDQGSGPNGRLCLVWLRDGDTYKQTSQQPPVTVQHFDRSSATFVVKVGGQTLTYAGKVTGKHIDGTVAYSLDRAPTTKMPSFKWSANFYNPPTGDPAPGHHVYVACNDKVSVVNTANHAVTTVPLPPGIQVGAIAVAPGSKLAYVSSNGNPQHPGELFVIDGDAGAVAKRVDMSRTGTPSGVTSLAVSGDGSTLYGIGWDRAHLGNALVSLSAASGAAISAKPLPKGKYLVVSGQSLIADDGTVLDSAVPGQPVFGNGGHGLVAFPDGVHVCVGNGVEDLGTHSVQRGKGCSAVAASGGRTFIPGRLLDSQGSMVSALYDGSIAMDPDGRTLYDLTPDVFGMQTHGSVLLTYDALTSDLTDVLRVCESPQLLGVAPLDQAVAVTSATMPAQSRQIPAANPGPDGQTKPIGAEAIAKADPDRVVANIDGHPIKARDAAKMLERVDPRVRKEREQKLPELLQQLYMQHAIAQEAAQLHLDKVTPWTTQLGNAETSTVGRFKPASSAPPAVVLAWNNARDRILYTAFFSRAATPEEKAALLNQKKQQYSIQVVDEDFFKPAN